MTIAPETISVGIARRFTTGVHPYDEVTWEKRDVKLAKPDGTVVFHQSDVEVPDFWGQNATQILAQKYFRGNPGTPERETSLRQVIDRIVHAIQAEALSEGYLDEEESRVFADELTWLLLHQRAAFNSPVWFNVGAPGRDCQVSACFILGVEDDMESILNWYVEEGKIFKGGSGAGINLSDIRSSRELLSTGGTPSGPVSFMRGADASAGTIKSGGATRRAAKMVVLDVDHPDIRDFIWCKAKEERKIRALAEAGFDMGVDGADIASVQFQNANNSVRLSDEFMLAVKTDGDWDLTARTDGRVIETVKAREIFNEIARSAWECADPGVQFSTTINRWNTTPASGEIRASNPCFPGSARVHTDRGLLSFDALVDRIREGESIRVYTHDATSPSEPAHTVTLTSPDAVMLTGTQDIVRLEFDNGQVLRCTPKHRIWTANREYVEAEALTPEDEVYLCDLPTPAVAADYGIPVSADPTSWSEGYEHSEAMRLPQSWSGEFAHYLGWLVGDGWITSTNQVATVYGPQDQAEILPRHQAALAEIGGMSYKAVMRPNGCAQLSFGRRAFARFLQGLGVKAERAPLKGVPWAVFEAPPEIQSAFLRGLFDADGTVVGDRSRGAYVGLASTSIDLLRGVQKLLTSFGIFSRVYETRGSDKTGVFPYRRKDGTLATYESRQMYDLRVTSESMASFAEEIGFDLSYKASIITECLAGRTRTSYKTRRVAHLAARVSDGVEQTYNLTEPKNHSYVVDGVVVANCSEHLRLDNSACNLSSINLLSFFNDGVFDIGGFRHAVRVMTLAQEVLISLGDYPTEKIAEVTKTFRDIGVGYANMGALLMSMGLAYDSVEGREIAAAITAILTGEVYATSAGIAGRVGPFAAFDANREALLDVLDAHRNAISAARQSHSADMASEMWQAASGVWHTATYLAGRHGVRNAEATVIAPTGTISLLMGCETTGVEPAFGLVSYKALVGGGSMTLPTESVTTGLRALGYDETAIDEIAAYVAEHGSLSGAPGFDEAHLPVFATSLGDNPISPMGHVAMIGAIQPFLSGAVSKTCNLPAEATVEDIADLYMKAWESGVKCLAIYRDGCKSAQPLSVKTKAEKAEPQAESQAAASAQEHPKAVRERLPRHRAGKTFAFKVGDCEGYATVGEYTDGRPGEVFMKVSKQGSTLAGIMDAFSISVSLGLQHGVPLSTYVRKYTNMRFEPAGMTDDPDIRFATSLIDYIFRRLALDYLDREEREGLGVLSISERSQPTLPGMEEMAAPPETAVDAEIGASIDGYNGSAVTAKPQVNGSNGHVPAPVTTSATGSASKSASAKTQGRDAPLCYQCGTFMQRAGSCYVCSSCGTTSGCS